MGGEAIPPARGAVDLLRYLPAGAAFLGVCAWPSSLAPSESFFAVWWESR